MQPWWNEIVTDLLLHYSKSISNFYYFPQSNSLYFSAFRSVSFLRGFRGGFECNDISIQFRPPSFLARPLAPFPRRPPLRVRVRSCAPHADPRRETEREREPALSSADHCTTLHMGLAQANRHLQIFYFHLMPSYISQSTFERYTWGLIENSAHTAY